MPSRIRRDKMFGWKCPDNAVYVGRPSRWGNPYKMGSEAQREEVISKFVDYLTAKLFHQPDFLQPLIGKDLACWCPLDKPCHADVILRWLHVLYGQRVQA